MNFCSPQPGYFHMREMVLDSVVSMAKDFSSILYEKVKGNYEESSADMKFPLSTRWRKAKVPMILLNQLDVQGSSGTDGDISIFCRNLKAMDHPTARNWYSNSSFTSV